MDLEEIVQNAEFREMPEWFSHIYGLHFFVLDLLIAAVFMFLWYKNRKDIFVPFLLVHAVKLLLCFGLEYFIYGHIQIAMGQFRLYTFFYCVVIVPFVIVLFVAAFMKKRSWLYLASVLIAVLGTGWHFVLNGIDMSF